MTTPMPRSRRGQVLVLACLTLFTMAAMLMTSFSLTNAIHERIRIQAHADSTAYSVATLEARSLNVLAYQNRAIATTMVSMMAVHAWMAIATMSISLMEAGEITMVEIIIEEVLLGCYYPNFSHCPHVIDGVMALLNYMDGKSTYEDAVEGKESAFNNIIMAFNYSLIVQYGMELATVLATGAEVAVEGDALKALKAKNAKKSSYASAVLVANGAEYQCALENTPTDGLCAKLEGSSHSTESMDELSKIMANAANAARPSFDRDGCGYKCFMAANYKVYPTGLRKDMQNNTGVTGYFYKLYASTGEEFNRDAPDGDTSTAIGSGIPNSAFGIVGFHCASGGFKIGAEIFSSKSGGQHSAGDTAKHDKFKGMAKESGPLNANFVNFRGDYPNTYAAVSQDLGLGINGSHVGAKAWEINSQAKMRVNLGSSGTVEVPLKPKGTANAVAKGVVYFHQPGNWQAQGNLFDPFWHGKLHFFKRSELLKVLALSGDTDGAAVAATGPVEGEN